MALEIVVVDDHRHREAHGGDAVEESHRRPAHRAEERAAHARHPVFERQCLDVRVEAERMQQQRAGEREPRNNGISATRCPQRVPQRARRMRAAPAAVGLRHEGLHREADAAEQQDRAAQDPVDSAHRRHRVGGEPADEPQVGEIEQRLHGVGGHERRGELEDLRAGRRAAVPAASKRCAGSATSRACSCRCRWSRCVGAAARSNALPSQRVMPSSTTHSPAHSHAMPHEPDAGDQQVEPLRRPCPSRAAARCR